MKNFKNQSLDRNTIARLDYILSVLNKEKQQGCKWLTDAERTAFIDILKTIRQSVFQRTYELLKKVTGKGRTTLASLFRKLADWGIISKFTNKIRKKINGSFYVVNTPLKIYLNLVTIDEIANRGGISRLKPPSALRTQTNRKNIITNNNVINRAKNIISGAVDKFKSNRNGNNEKIGQSLVQKLCEKYKNDPEKLKLIISGELLV